MVYGGGEFYSQFSEKGEKRASKVTFPAGFSQAVSWNKADEALKMVPP